MCDSGYINLQQTGCVLACGLNAIPTLNYSMYSNSGYYGYYCECLSGFYPEWSGNDCSSCADGFVDGRFCLSQCESLLF